MGVQTEFINFHNRIKLGCQDDAYRKARERDDSITAAIKSAFKDEGYPVTEDFLQGSLATDTAILKKADDFDIDRSIVIDSTSAPDNPVDPKKVVFDVLEKRGFKNAKIKKPCVTANYSSENLHIDFPIYRKKADGTYELAVGKRNSDEENREWSESDPKGLKSWIKDKSSYIGSADRKLQQFNRVARYLKRWRDHQFSESVCKKIFSIGLTVMAKRGFVPNVDKDGKFDDLSALLCTVSHMVDYGYFSPVGEQYRVTVHLPVPPRRDIFDGSSLSTGTQLRNKLINMRNKLDEASKEENLTKKCEILNKLFGEDFHIPSDSENNGSSNNKASRFASAGIVGTSQGA
ncbi:SMODS domain-containing nucleotidyltransferase [Neptuniibacter sp. QD37_11]|uniref:SMODS domain-containing nucleotidyltransferase n=1 Tax=Neptuniibacter sp. QD37_11 TaxID=3398209 RepID=UPI0039F5E768